MYTFFFILDVLCRPMPNICPYLTSVSHFIATFVE